MAQVLDEALNEVEVLQTPSPAGQTENRRGYVPLSRQATSLPTKARLAKPVFYLPESS